MPTPSEQKALAFLAFVILLGGAVRVVRAGPPGVPTADESSALDRQRAAAETTHVRGAAKKGTRGVKMSRRRRNGGADTVAGVAGVPFSDVRPDRPGPPGAPYNPRDGFINGFPPPSPRIDRDNRPEPPAPGSSSGRPGPGAATVDLNVATAAELDRLPRVGRATAARIIANRDSFGPFRSLDDLGRVKGMGPATLRRLAPHVTFSGRAASLSAESRPR